MTQLGEPVDIGILVESETKCPFDHSEPKPPNVKNDLIGVGTTLAKRMEAGDSTHLYSKYRTAQEAVLNPKNVSGHALFQSGARKPRPVVLQIWKDVDDEPRRHTYPVTCAAHHCIPAQETLKQCPQLLEFMVKKGSTEKLKDDSFSDGVVWSDVGYDVNGLENGVFLPGNYAVGGGRGGMGVWEGDDDDDDDDEAPEADAGGDDGDEDAVSLDDDEPILDSAPSSNALNGTSFNVDPNNRKWRYVARAMKLTPGQFHDRHENYSDFVLDILLKIHAEYQVLKERKYDAAECPDCKERAKKLKKLGVPTPYGLVARLNSLSKRLAGLLRGPGWSPLVYTSKWVKNYLDKRV